MRRFLLISLFLLFLGIVYTGCEKKGDIVYVKEGGTGDGSSWDNAFGDLQKAIEAADRHQTKKRYV